VVTGETIRQEIASVTKSEDALPAITILRARNTLALLKLAPDASDRNTASLLTAITAAEKVMRDTEVGCFACRGTGQRIYTMTDLHGDVRQQSAAAGTVGCPVCGGSGKIPARATQTALIAQMSTANQTFERQQQARGWEGVAGVWVPKGVAEHLTLRQKAALKTTASSPCKTCYGLGFFGCTTCSGEGKLKCTNAKCVQGREPCPMCKGKRKITETTKGHSIEHNCPNCSGTGISICATCQGRGFLPCVKCESTGQIRCTACKGTGENGLCQKCDGSGLIPCRVCKGEGRVKGAPCTDCKGEKVVPCTTCDGTGHKRSSY
jgi:hypothetical protein